MIDVRYDGSDVRLCSRVFFSKITGHVNSDIYLYIYRTFIYTFMASAYIFLKMLIFSPWKWNEKSPHPESESFEGGWWFWSEHTPIRMSKSCGRPVDRICFRKQILGVSGTEKKWYLRLSWKIWRSPFYLQRTNVVSCIVFKIKPKVRRSSYHLDPFGIAAIAVCVNYHYAWNYACPIIDTWAIKNTSVDGYTNWLLGDYYNP